MLRISLQSLFVPSMEAAARVLPLVLHSLCKRPAQQQVSQNPHTSSHLQSFHCAAYNSTVRPYSMWHNSRNLTRSSRLQAVMPSLADSRCCVTSAAAAAADDIAKQFLQAGDLQQLQQLVQQALPDSSSSLSCADAAAAYAALARLAGSQPAAAAAAAAAATPVLQLLAPTWQAALPASSIQDVANALVCWAKLGYFDAQLWASTLSVVPGLCSGADGQDLSNVALALATAAEAGGGAVPGVNREEAEEVLRVVTHQLVSMVTAASADAAGAAAAAAVAGGESSGKGVTMSNIATLRWAHEVFENSVSS
ncbi:hypothetical protein COO60DRAFT_421020 [Scenedesmus sp. NREL 46B-D3]|nr:hypothetical protein COO60DRAFT_421020 [Scenedesmus sp. NREL 46B-D3]